MKKNFFKGSAWNPFKKQAIVAWDVHLQDYMCKGHLPSKRNARGS